DFGLSVDVGSTSVSGLIEALQKLRGEMSQELPVLLSQQLNTITDKLTELRRLEAEREKANQVNTGVNILGGGLDPLELIKGLGPQGQQV
ncbi:hypothetical protein, partial [Escherichia coli]|uniref:hypothetical protein n=1 Tax=Escherichia coli TaxID=562 RepID=UPI00256F2C42